MELLPRSYPNAFARFELAGPTAAAQTHAEQTINVITDQGDDVTTDVAGELVVPDA